MITIVRATAALAAFALAAAATAAASADTLTAHDKAAVAHLIYKRSDCLDCGKAPSSAPWSWKFASDYGLKHGVGAAYLVVHYKTVDRTRAYDWLLSFDANVGRWRILEQGYKGSFMCSAAVLVNPNYRVAYQMRLLERVARCATG